MQNSLSGQLSPGREQYIELLPVVFQCASSSSDAAHLTLLLAVQYSSGCQAHLDAQRSRHTTVCQVRFSYVLLLADATAPRLQS